MKIGWVISFICLAAAGCSRERARAVDPVAKDVQGGPADYQQMVNRARNRRTAEDNLAMLEDARKRFLNDRGRLPSNLVEMVSNGFLSSIPEAPAGTQFSYDPGTGNIRMTATRPTSIEIPSGGPQAPSLIGPRKP